MTKIKFSHCYQKILDIHNDVIESAKLLGVFRVNLEHLHPSFISYDTDDGKYKLPKKGEYIMLLFLKPFESYVTDTNLFTTLRRYTLEKYEYYQKQIGLDFEIVVLKEAQDDCPHDPRELKGAPIGMYHCPVCGEMVVAGMEHGKVQEEEDKT